MSPTQRHRHAPLLVGLLGFVALVAGSGASVASAAGEAARTRGEPVWQLLVGDGAAVPAGFDRRSWAVTAVQEWRGALYLGASTDSSAAYGCQVWRTTDGSTLTQVGEDGFGDGDNTELPAMAVFGEHLYAGTSNYDYAGGSSGARLWRTADGVVWEPVSRPGFGDPFTGHLRSLAVFNGALYVGLGNRYAGSPQPAPSAQVWRSDSGDPETWELVHEEGGSLPQRYVAETLVVFGDRLYLILADPETWGYPKLSSTADGTTWEQLPDFDGQCWFDRGESVSAAVVGDTLYVASLSNLEGGPICRSRDGVSWEPLPGVQATKLATCGDELCAGQAYGGVMRSADGLEWQPVGPAQINGAVHALGELDGVLYVGSMNRFLGCEVWRLHRPFSRLSPEWVVATE